MKHVWLNRQGHDTLIVFFNGWGMDDNPFAHLGCSGHDVLMFYDYRGLEFRIDPGQLLAQYSQHLVISWSMGVWVYAQVASAFKPVQVVAINGTLYPIHDQLGIPVAILEKTLRGFSDSGREKFYLRMFRNHKERQLFRNPDRDLENQRIELSALQQMVLHTETKPSPFSKVFISDNDRIIPTRNQKNYWESYCQPMPLESGHFPFMHWQSWREITE